MNSKFEEYFSSLKDKKIAVLGLGVSNRPLVRLLLEFGCDVIGCDKTPREKLDDEVLALEKAGCKLGCLGVPEFGTDFAMQMLIDTKPQYFSDLVRIAGLSYSPV